MYDVGLFVVVMCVLIIYGGGDWGCILYGVFIVGVVFGRLFFMMCGIWLEVVGVDDVVRVLILVVECGCNGEWYFIFECMMLL